MGRQGANITGQDYCNRKNQLYFSLLVQSAMVKKTVLSLLSGCCLLHVSLDVLVAAKISSLEKRHSYGMKVTER